MSSGRPSSSASRPSRLQGLCALIGLAVILAVVGILSRAVVVEARPPDLIVQAESVRRASGGWVLDVTVVNRGDLTAAAVEVEGVSGDETAHATLDYVPGHGRKAAALVFSGDERPNAALRVLGWSSP